MAGAGAGADRGEDEAGIVGVAWVGVGVEVVARVIGAAGIVGTICIVGTVGVVRVVGTVTGSGDAVGVDFVTGRTDPIVNGTGVIGPGVV